MKQILFLLLFSISSLLAGFKMMNQDILGPDEAFQVDAHKKDGLIQTKIKLGDKIYVYDDKLKYKIVKPKEIDLDKEIKRPKPEKFHDFIVHRNKEIDVDIPLDLIRKKVDGDTFTLAIEYQGCSEKGLCYQPLKKEFTFKLDKAGILKTATPQKSETVQKEERTKLANVTPEQDSTSAAQEPISEEDRIVNTLKGGSIWTILGLFFGFGLLLSLTPCIFPMIPILSSIIVSQSGEGKAKMSMGRGLFLSSVYVFAMAIAYTIAGVFAGLFGANIQTALQNPWVLSIFALIFVALAFSMFGYYEIQLPQALQSKLTKTSDQAQNKGGLMGVAVMGFLSALIVGPCVAPALAGALVYIGQTGDALLGGAALFVMSLGMGVPLLIVGAGAGKFMPKPGGWMTLVSQIFGVVMLGIAIWMIQRIIPGYVTLFLWAMLFIGSAVYMGVLEPFKEGTRGEKKLIKVLAVILLVTGILELIGAFTGATDPLDPLEKLKPSPIATTNASLPARGLSFKIVKNIDELDKAIAQSDKPVMLDFSADWCSACKELEHNTFKDPEVIKLLSGFTLLRADVTQNSDEDKALLKRYNLFGPPAMLFYKNGKMLKNYKTIGYKPPEKFIPILKKTSGK
ncbi:MAG: thiol:disulfide interchange protein [Sulfurospirillum sp.]|nr:MAG: thiol:disulfide interchange protein [Sulfurospirillum sp.]